MKEQKILIMGMLAVCVLIGGCASAEKNVQTAVDGTYQAVMETDEWIRKNMW